MSPPTSIRSTLAEALRGWPPPPLDPAGPHAGLVATLSWVLFGMALAVLLMVSVALVVALAGKSEWRDRLGREWLIWSAGLALPIVVLTGVLIYGLTATQALSQAPQPGEMRVRVTGEMWWWRVAYLDAEGRPAIHDANELHIPAGVPVTLELEAADVIHSFWVPRLAGKLDMIPGRRNILRIQADRPGVYGGQCAEYCGGPHALMGFVVVAHAPEDFQRWRAARLAPPPAAPADGLAARGAQVFRDSGCGACHRVAGTEAGGLAGPDLTFVGARRSLGAGILANNQGTLAGWVADSQAIKPGNRMPAYRMLSGGDLRALAAYLESRR
ncbi:cytochrome c oxidase, subunit II [Phenylobacterium zucineum HLK1]|uniref:Cytochrome aa3 subunit 2 n=1 Tax=Phenylobacterium zucineum (strain HLK1) TaxID=450851 RepID=B4RAU6_PHEZH|nr:cytochrome c oxidase subunit II [Phenylobacterium zucineum]ACG77997.1 cytochrome c oxidase, subunit II [Phenylobacterium zucineum HLK1]